MGADGGIAADLVLDREFLSQKGELTENLQAALDRGVKNVYFPEGEYKIGSLSVPSNVTLSFGSAAVVVPDGKKIKDLALFTVVGPRVTMKGLHVRFPVADGHEMGVEEIRSIIYAKGIDHLSVLGARVFRKQNNFKVSSGGGLAVVYAEACEDITIRDCEAEFVFALLHAKFCRRLRVADNRVEDSQYITLASIGCEWLTHEGNWSRNVRHQCQWWGGDSNDSLEQVPRGTASIVKRGSKASDPDFKKDTAGAYDIQVIGNYAEYGVTLAWGSKGRNVVIANNIARYMEDMAYDTEGSGSVVISNNISINAKYFGIGCYFWGDSVVISGNLVMVEPEGDPVYQGNFLRLHSPNTRSFGNRKILITGNQFVAREGKPRVITIEASEDVTISGNKLVNGRISLTAQAQEVLILNNDIRNSLPGNYPVVGAVPGVRRLIIKDNVLRRDSNEEAPLAMEAALSQILTRDGCTIVEGNIIEGWKYSAWTGMMAEGSGKVVFRDNNITGEILKDRNTKAARLFHYGSLNINTMSGVEFREATDQERQVRPRVPSQKPVDTVIPNAPLPANQ